MFCIFVIIKINTCNRKLGNFIGFVYCFFDDVDKVMRMDWLVGMPSLKYPSSTPDLAKFVRKIYVQLKLSTDFAVRKKRALNKLWDYVI